MLHNRSAGGCWDKVLNPDLLMVTADVFRQLLLVQRYDRHFGRDMYQALALLLILRNKGEAGLEQSVAKMFGVAAEN